MYANNVRFEEAIQIIHKAESQLSLSEPWIDDCRNELRGPASHDEIEQCEAFLGREFSPSYRNFLALHNGWIGCLSGGHLLGTADYECNAVTRDAFTVALYTNLLYAIDFDSQGNVPTVPSGLYAPEKFYRFIDAPTEFESPYARLKAFINGYEERHSHILHAKHTLIRLGQNYVIVLDGSTRRLDGEMDVVKWSEGFEERWPNFYNMIFDAAESYAVESEDSHLQVREVPHGARSL